MAEVSSPEGHARSHRLHIQRRNQQNCGYWPLSLGLGCSGFNREKKPSVDKLRLSKPKPHRGSSQSVGKELGAQNHTWYGFSGSHHYLIRVKPKGPYHAPFMGFGPYSSMRALQLDPSGRMSVCAPGRALKRSTAPCCGSGLSFTQLGQRP